MKKITVIVLAMLMVLAIGQSAFAKNYVGLALGYDGAWGSFKYIYGEDDYDAGDSTRNAFKASLFINTYLTNRFSLAAGITIKTGPEIVEGYEYYEGEKYPWDPNESQNTDLGFYLFGRYDIFQGDNTNVGVQLGLMNTAIIWPGNSMLKGMSVLGQETTDYGVASMSLLALGAYGDFYVTPKLNVYTDVKLPIGFWGNTGYNDVNFFNVFLYDIILGTTYEIYPNIGLGIEASISNVNYDGITTAVEKKYGLYDGEETSYFNFSIGAKVGYSF